VEKPDSGRITLEARRLWFAPFKHAQRWASHQICKKINLCSNLTVAENI
jgi:ABC-type sugar transport system ATPase subunit